MNSNDSSQLPFTLLESMNADSNYIFTVNMYSPVKNDMAIALVYEVDANSVTKQKLDHEFGNVNDSHHVQENSHPSILKQIIEYVSNNVIAFFYVQASENVHVRINVEFMNHISVYI